MSGEIATVIEEVLTVERAWVQAIKSRDIPTLERILAEDYTQILADGNVIGKQAALESYKSLARYWEYAESVDHEIRIYGNTAVMLALWKARGENHGKKFDYQSRFLAVYVKNAGQWQLTADQSTPIPYKAAASSP
jgi:ketosteroid isomerase-like protein